MTEPILFAPSDAPFWDDPHIASQMLYAHLDPNWDAASYNHQTIAAIYTFLGERFGLQEGSSILDLGCGPGLYSVKFASDGVKVTGFDVSKNSLDYARGYAESHGLDITYIHQDYLTLDIQAAFDAAVLISCDYGVLAPERRSNLLARVYRALRPGGWFALDVFTHEKRRGQEITKDWSIEAQGGFWRKQPHIVLSETIAYPDRDVYLDHYTIVDVDGSQTHYRLWEQAFDRLALVTELENAGFLVQDVYASLAGDPWTSASQSVAAVVRKPS